MIHFIVTRKHTLHLFYIKVSGMATIFLNTHFCRFTSSKVAVANIITIFFSEVIRQHWSIWSGFSNTPANL